MCKTTEHLFKQQEEACKAAEHIFMQEEEACKTAEDLFKQQEEARNAIEHIFNEWEHIQLNIRELSRALGNETNELINSPFPVISPNFCSMWILI